MLRRIKIEDLKEGMVFSEPLFFDDGKNRVLSKMLPVSQRELSVLKKWKVPFVMTAGKIVKKDTEVDSLVGTLDTLPDEADTAVAVMERKHEDTAVETDILALPEILTQSDLYVEYLSIIQSLDGFLNDIKLKKTMPDRPIDGIALKVHNLLAADKTMAISFVLCSEITEWEMAKSLVDSAILAEVIASFMKVPDGYRNEIILAALLHDCGMLKIPEAITKKKDKLSDTEIQAIAAHTMYGYKTVLSELMYTERIALIVLQHHERWDGKGYPNGLSKESIELGARILAVVDAFVTMTTTKMYHKALLGYDAMKTLAEDKGRRFDYEVIKAMIRSIGVYPIGSVVLMNDTSFARVVGIAPEAPLRPLVRQLTDETGKEFPHNTGKLIDLREYKNTFIVKAVDRQVFQKK